MKTGIVKYIVEMKGFRL